jgi:DNA-binding NarL/FixJ family response regulator
VTTPKCGSGILAQFGLDAATEAIWRSLLATPSATVEEVARMAGLTTPNVHAGLGRLLDARLVRVSSTPSGVVVIDPTLAVESHIATEERRLAERAAALAAIRAQLPEVAGEYDRGRASLGHEPGFEVVVGLEEIRRHLYLAAQGKRRECRNVIPNPRADALRDADQIDFDALARGVRMRTIVGSAGLETPGTYEVLKDHACHGEEIRKITAPPAQMVVLDDDLAVLPVNAAHESEAALFVRAQSMINALIYLFEALWTDASPVFIAAQDDLAPDGRSAQILELLAAGAKDDRISRALGVGVRTIRRDISEIKATLGVSTRTQVVAAAVRKGWL